MECIQSCYTCCIGAPVRLLLDCENADSCLLNTLAIAIKIIVLVGTLITIKLAPAFAFVAIPLTLIYYGEYRDQKATILANDPKTIIKEMTAKSP